MKKVMAIWMVMALLCLPVLALAEQGEAVVTVDWTALVVAVIGTAAAFLGACLRQVWVQQVRPWLEQRNLGDAAKIVVEAVEALLGRYCGEDKWRMALEKMQARGFNVDEDQVVDALHAAWYQLNQAMILSGEKEKPAA
ncbi:MAG: hypothetical protein KHW80_12995 [Faecalibacterium sp.]|nr:hypothetical protein [Faecalibacterium sp.]